MRRKHKVLFVAIIALLAFSLYLLVRDYPDLPGRVPTHFNVSGNPDAWGSKNTILIFPGLQVLFLVISALVYKYPNYANVPSTIALKHLPEDLKEKAYELIRDMTLVVMALVSAMMAYLARENLAVAKGLEGSIGMLPVWVFLACLAPPIIYYTVEMRRLED